MGILATLCQRDIEVRRAPVSPLDYALDYIKRGYSPTPIPHRSKKPVLDGWQNRRIAADTASDHFSDVASNIGVILGEASGGLADIDIDCVEALEIADRVLPDTGSVFGRFSKPRSHRLYSSPGARTRQFKDPLTQAMLVELRANGGHQTVFPGSIHEDGEAIEWHVDGGPAEIDATTLLAAAVRLAAASVLVRYLGNDAIEQPIDSWAALLDAHDRRLGDAVRRWLSVGNQPPATPPEAPGTPEPADVGGFEHSEQFEHCATPTGATPSGSVLSAALRAESLRRYAERALDDEVARVSAAMPKGQHPALFVGAARMGELVGAGAIDEATVRVALFSATAGWPTDPKKGPWFAHQIERTIADGIKKGMSKPRDLSKVGLAYSMARPDDDEFGPSAEAEASTTTGSAARPDNDEFGPAAGAGASTTTGIWPEPDLGLINDDRAPAPPLEDDALPLGWAEWIEVEAQARGCPSDYVAAGLITFASAWIGNARHVAATPTWSEPLHIWLMLIGGPSWGKSPSLRPFVDTARTIEQDAEPTWRAALAQHAVLAAAAKFAEESWRDSVGTATAYNKPPPDRPASADAPPPPPRPRLMAMDATTEELQRLLAGQPRGLLYVRDELAGWLGNHDRYGGHGGDRAFYLECWNGGLYVVDRVKNNGVPLRIPRTSLAIVGGMQPDKLCDVLESADDGLAARLFYIHPEPAPIAALTADDPQAIARESKLLSAARRLCGLTMDSDSSGEAVPRMMQLDRDAFELFGEIRRDAMLRARDSRGLAAGWHGKNPGRALRLAGIYQLLAWAASDEVEPRAITVDALVRAGGYLDYAAGMLDRVTAGLAIGKAERDASTIARHILAARAATFNERKLYQQPGWAWLRDGPRRATALAVLERAGWIKPHLVVGNGRPRGDWEVSPRLWEAPR